jgi:hypothetical protein
MCRDAKSPKSPKNRRKIAEKSPILRRIAERENYA